MQPYNAAKAETNVHWDRFQLRHAFTDHNMFIHFETGESVATMAAVNRVGESDYRLYRDRNVIIAKTSSPSWPSLMKSFGMAVIDPETNDTVSAAWLNTTLSGKQDGQLMLIDLDHNIAVSMERGHIPVDMHDPRWGWIERKPRHIRKTPGAYYPTPESTPEGFGIRLSRPTKLSADERDHKRGIEAACKAWWSTAGWESMTDPRNGLGSTGWSTRDALWEADDDHFDKNPDLVPTRVERSRSPSSLYEQRHYFEKPVVWSKVQNITFAILPPTARARIALNGVEVERSACVRSWLRVDRKS
jgi:hypothetical protein